MSVAMGSRMRGGSWIFLLALWCTSYSGVGRAQQPQTAPNTRWYGAPIVIGGELGVAALAGESIAALDGGYVPTILWVPTLAAYLLTGPVVHLLNDEPVNAAASLGVNVLLPVIGSAIGLSTLLLASGCDNGLPHASGPRCSRAPFFTFIALGFLSAPLIDGLLIARTSAHRASAEPGAPGEWHPTFTPFVSPNGKDGVILGLGGWY